MGPQGPAGPDGANGADVSTFEECKDSIVARTHTFY